eukprot:7031778-Prymnesium_polylepis.4
MCVGTSAPDGGDPDPRSETVLRICWGFGLAGRVYKVERRARAAVPHAVLASDTPQVTSVHCASGKRTQERSIAYSNCTAVP